MHDSTAYDELYVYSMGRPGFILQHVVDAHAAQTATHDTKPIGLVFALVGLYLHVEKQFSGQEVQRVHMVLGQQKPDWPAIHLPHTRGNVTPADVLDAPAGPDRDRVIDEWCASVWEAFRDSRESVTALLGRHGII
jgi:hypothetical protein